MACDRQYGATLLLVACALLAGCSSLPHGFSSQVQKLGGGQKFGVSIEMSRQEAQKQLADNVDAQLWVTKECLSPSECEGAEVTETYHVPGGLTGGTISLFFTNSKVSKIVWYRNPFDP
jgi:hypothetical protein